MITTTTTTTATTRRPLIAGVLRKSFGRDCAADARAHGFTDAERHNVFSAARAGLDVRERTVDHVVERLLSELTW
jgi:hypothetical protein